MPLRYLLDTSICIYIAKAHPSEVLARFRKLQPGEVGMSAVTYGELCHGACKSLHRAEAEKILRELAEIVPVIGLGSEAGERYGEFRADLERRGQVIGNNDLWIAAHAIALGVPVVTNNEREFGRVPALALQNWVRRGAEIHERPASYHRTRRG